MKAPFLMIGPISPKMYMVVGFRNKIAINQFYLCVNVHLHKTACVIISCCFLNYAYLTIFIFSYNMHFDYIFCV